MSQGAITIWHGHIRRFAEKTRTLYRAELRSTNTHWSVQLQKYGEIQIWKTLKHIEYTKYASKNITDYTATGAIEIIQRVLKHGRNIHRNGSTV